MFYWDSIWPKGCSWWWTILNIKIAEKHQLYHNHQQNEYKKQKQNLKKGKAIAVIDFKENLHLNMVVEETSYNFYTWLKELILI